MLTSLLAATMLAATPAAVPCIPSDTLLALHASGLLDHLATPADSGSPRGESGCAVRAETAP